jgi:hypothetical protein
MGLFELDTISNATVAINCIAGLERVSISQHALRPLLPPARNTKSAFFSIDHLIKMGLLETVYQSVILSVVSNVLAQMISAHQENVRELACEKQPLIRDAEGIQD